MNTVSVKQLLAEKDICGTRGYNIYKAAESLTQKQMDELTRVHATQDVLAKSLGVIIICSLLLVHYEIST